jgi:FkbM family methyltransferase
MPSREGRAMASEYLRLLFRAWKYRLRNERAELGWILSRLKPGETCVDIGAHKGAYTYWMARRVGRGGAVHAFEPQPGLASGLEGLLRGRGMGQVRVHAAGLSDKSGEMALHVHAWGSSPCASLVAGNITGETREVRVPVRTLDEFAAAEKLARVALIKCDVEGHELAVFRGGRELLRRDRPALIFECESRFGGGGRVREVLEFLRGLNYDGVALGRGGSVALSAFDVDTHQKAGHVPYYNNFAVVCAR